MEVKMPYEKYELILNEEKTDSYFAGFLTGFVFCLLICVVIFFLFFKECIPGGW
jgi:hypothetical protein